MKHTLILPDGTSVSSGAAGAAIQSVKLTASVNPEPELAPGGVCAAELEVTLFDAGVTIRAGDVLLLRDETGPVGTFIAQQPTRLDGARLRVLAYDTVSRLDVDGAAFLASVSFPITLGEFARALCGHCGMQLTGEPENGDYPIAAFEARGVTCRQLMQWVCQAGCRFCRADPEGGLVLDWYRDRGLTLLSEGEEFYYRGGLVCESYTVPPIGRVRIAQSEGDVGASWPAEGENALSLVGNYLLCDDPEPVAQALYGALAGLTYTPCTVLTNVPVAPGEIFRVVRGGETVTALAMTVERSGGRFRVACTGSASRDAAAACRSDYRALAGRVLNLQWGLDGAKSQLAEFSKTAAQVSELSQDVDHITARVSVLQTGADTMGKTLDDLSQTAQQEFAQLRLRSDGLEVSVGAVQQAVDSKADAAELEALTEHFVFDTGGLTISDSATGMAVRVSQEAVAFSGGEAAATSITPTGMVTTDLAVGRRLDVGAFSLIPRTGGNLSLRWTGGSVEN